MLLSPVSKTQREPKGVFFMRRSSETYAKVGQACSEYKRKPYPGQVYNRAGESNELKPSCLSCTHFKDEHCVIDMYDKVASRLEK